MGSIKEEGNKGSVVTIVGVDSQAMPSDSQSVLIVNSQPSSTDSFGSIAYSSCNTVEIDNSTNFPDVGTHDFRPGDRVKAKSAKIYGIPANRVLTILKTENMATVTLEGCRSATGCEVPLSHLYHA